MPEIEKVVSVRVPVSVTSLDDTFESDVTPPAGGDESKLETRMSQEVERVLSEWDSNRQRITTNSLSIRPAASPLDTVTSHSTPNSPFSTRRKRGGSNQQTLLNTSLPMRASCDAVNGCSRHVFQFPEVSVTQRQETRLSENGEGTNDNRKSPLYINCPRTGSRVFRMEFDCEGYPHDSIGVKVVGEKVVIQARREERVDGRVSSNEFCRKVKLPPDVDKHLLECHIDPAANTLIISAPAMNTLRPRVNSTSSNTSGHSPKSPFSHSKHSSLDPLNTPQSRVTSLGNTFFLNAEVGGVFRPDDVTVKVIGRDKLIVSAERSDDSATQKLRAHLSREFSLPFRIIPQTLQAGLTTDGVLKVSALIETDESASTNATKVHIELADDVTE